MRIGLALGGGGAAALAQIGVLDALRAAGLEVHCVAGTSAGSVVGAALAAGRLEPFREAMKSLTRRRALWLFGPAWPRAGIFDGKSSMDFLRPYIGEEIETLEMPYAAIAADLETGEEVVIDRGPVVDAIRSSIAIPGLFTPNRHADRWLVDGCLVNPMPVAPARRLGAEFVIAVNVLPIGDRTHSAYVEAYRALRRRSLGDRVRELLGAAEVEVDDEEMPVPATERELGLWAVLAQASLIVQARIAVARLREAAPDFLIHVPLSEVGLFDFGSVPRAIECGREVTEAALADLRIAFTGARRGSAIDRMRRRLRERWLVRRPVPAAIRATVPQADG